jgi:hypothetical protein
MVYGPKISACCGSEDGVEEPHLYLKSDPPRYELLR